MVDEKRTDDGEARWERWEIDAKIFGAIVLGAGLGLQPYGAYLDLRS